MTTKANLETPVVKKPRKKPKVKKTWYAEMQEKINKKLNK